VHLGTGRVPDGEKFDLFVLAHPDKRRFRGDEVLTEIPDDCVASDPVTVSAGTLAANAARVP
jgi:hypothetical protein